MGHLRPSSWPKTRSWGKVADLLERGAGVSEIASATFNASQKKLLEAPNDSALVYSFWLLTQISFCARSSKFIENLRTRGFSVSDQPTLMEIVGEFAKVIDSHVRQHGKRSDIGEMAQLAATESLTTIGIEKTQKLFQTTSEDVRRAFSTLSTKKQFETLAHDFFSRFIRRYLSYYLSCVLSNHVGANRRFFNIERHIDFNKALDIHCEQTTLIVREFASDWFSKTEFEGGIDLNDTAEFINVALKKIKTELAERGRQ